MSRVCQHCREPIPDVPAFAGLNFCSTRCAYADLDGQVLVPKVAGPKPFTRVERVTKTCARTGCLTTWQATPGSAKKYCSPTCALTHLHLEGRLGPYGFSERSGKRRTPTENRTCQRDGCEGTFVALVTETRRYCSASCATKLAAAKRWGDGPRPHRPKADPDDGMDYADGGLPSPVYPWHTPREDLPPMTCELPSLRDILAERDARLAQTEPLPRPTRVSLTCEHPDCAREFSVIAAQTERRRYCSRDCATQHKAVRRQAAEVLRAAQATSRHPLGAS